MRGTRSLSRGHDLPFGIIPACAGNTSAPCQARPSARDHPRVCGEHSKECVPIWDNQGSSPRVRGTPACRRILVPPNGIIPACAGNTSCSTCSSPAGRDHPRVCGEHHRLNLELQRLTGSSPRVRGTRRQQTQTENTAGIIPACAGNTTDRVPTLRRPWDHPRVCGEH